MSENPPMRVMVLAAEPSGDRLGAGLIRAMRARSGTELAISGIGGPAMRAQGVKSLFPITDLAVMGLVEVIPRLPRLARRVRKAARHVIREQPDIVVTIDSPDFMHRVVARARPKCPRTGFVNYVAPSVWMWRPGRAKKVARLYDLQLALLPFEPEWFKRQGLDCEFVGHPASARFASDGDSRARARNQLNLPAEDPVMVVLPGSRISEIERHGRIFGKAVRRIADEHANLRVVIPVAPGIEREIAAMAADWAGAPILLAAPADENRQEEHRLAFASADVALAASGTVTLELAAAGVPMVVAYRLAALTWQIGKRLRRNPYACLVNILLDAPCVPEFIQRRCRADSLARAVTRLLNDADARAEQRAGLRRATALVQAPGDLSPSESAARATLGFAERRKVAIAS